jgi:hypothetical protein
MKQDTSDTAVKEEDIGDIKRKQSDNTIYMDWRRRKSLKKIAGETGLAIEEANRRLKRILKSEVKKHGVENNEKENNT